MSEINTSAFKEKQIYKIKAYANLRHYLPDGKEEYLLEVSNPKSVDDILETIGITKPEIMIITNNGKPITGEEFPDMHYPIEIFPVLSGG